MPLQLFATSGVRHRAGGGGPQSCVGDRRGIAWPPRSGVSNPLSRSGTSKRPGQASTAAQWVSTAHQAVQSYSVGGYVNYLEASTSAARYFGSNLLRLTAVRQKYDPNRVMFSGLDF